MTKYRVTVRRSGLTDSLRGFTGTATFWGHADNGEEIYRVVFGEPGFEHSANFVASDLIFQEDASENI